MCDHISKIYKFLNFLKISPLSIHLTQMKFQIHLILKFNFESINFTKLLRALQPTLVSFDQFLFTKIKISKLKK